MTDDRVKQAAEYALEKFPECWVETGKKDLKTDVNYPRRKFAESVYLDGRAAERQQLAIVGVEGAREYWVVKNSMRENYFYDEDDNRMECGTVFDYKYETPDTLKVIEHAPIAAEILRLREENAELKEYIEKIKFTTLYKESQEKDAEIEALKAKIAEYEQTKSAIWSEVAVATNDLKKEVCRLKAKIAELEGK